MDRWDIKKKHDYDGKKGSMAKEGTAHGLNDTTSSYGVCVYGCWWNWSSRIIDDVTADKSRRMTNKVYWETLSVQIHPNALTLIGQLLSVDRQWPEAYNWKCSMAKLWNVLIWPSHCPDLNLKFKLHFTCRRQNWRKTPQKQAQTEYSCIKDLTDRWWPVTKHNIRWCLWGPGSQKIWTHVAYKKWFKKICLFRYLWSFKKKIK